MKLIESSYVIVPQDPGLEGIYKQIEKAGRLCYKSEDKICEGSAEKMVEFLKNRGHGSPLEHGTIYLNFCVTYDLRRKKLPPNCMHVSKYMATILPLLQNRYTKIVTVNDATFSGIKQLYITTNLRVLVEANRLDLLDYICEPTEHHEKRISVKFILSRSIANEFVRHRVFSFCQESQRYCNYHLGKFGGEITYIIPDWIKIKMNDLSQEDFDLASDLAVIKWKRSLLESEQAYLYLTQSENVKPQDARSVLPNDCKTELMMTGFVSD
jgi:thymidylate synthase (FAD)